MKIDLGPFFICAICSERHRVESALRMVHILGRHPALAKTVFRDCKAIDRLFVPDFERH